MSSGDVAKLVKDFENSARQPNANFSLVYADLIEMENSTSSPAQLNQEIYQANRQLIIDGAISTSNGLPNFMIVGADQQGHIITANPATNQMEARDLNMNVLGQQNAPYGDPYLQSQGQNGNQSGNYESGNQSNQYQPGNPNYQGTNFETGSQPSQYQQNPNYESTPQNTGYENGYQPQNNPNQEYQNGSQTQGNGGQQAPYEASMNGREVTVEPDGSARYTVVSGDTVSAVADDVLHARLGRTPSQTEIMNEVNVIAQASGLQNANLIYPGNVLTIPASDGGNGYYNPQAYDNPYSSSSGNAAIVQAAMQDLGQQMWTHFSSTDNGNYGCAASVSEVLQQAGYQYADSASVRDLETQLEDNGWTAVSSPEPGDAIFGYRTDPNNSGGDGAHTGIVGPNSTVYNNQEGSDGSETWQQTPLSDFNQQEFPYGIIALRPPAGSGQSSQQYEAQQPQTQQPQQTQGQTSSSNGLNPNDPIDQIVKMLSESEGNSTSVNWNDVGQGISVGMYQANQDGGPLLTLFQAMYKADPTQFQQIFQSNTQSLLSQSSLQQLKFTQSNQLGQELQQALQIPEFQQAQLNLDRQRVAGFAQQAESKYGVTSPEGIALYSYMMNWGPALAQKYFSAATGTNNQSAKIQEVASAAQSAGDSTAVQRINATIGRAQQLGLSTNQTFDA